jgi:hypothetical protein
VNLRVSDPGLGPALAAYLRARSDVLVKELRDGSLNAGVLGSHADGGRRELKRYLRGWEAAHRVSVEFAS